MSILGIENTSFEKYLDKQVSSKLNSDGSGGVSIWDLFGSLGDGSGSDIVSYAKKFLGCNEADGSADKFLNGGSSSATPWCGAFVNFIMKHVAGNKSWFNMVQNPLYCPSIDEAAKSANVQTSASNAKAGDIVLFDWDGDGVKDHVGIIASNNNGTITTIEGNSSDQVQQNSYNASDGRLTICKMA